jgi:DNA polymerase elongation subunit (family B)
MKYYTNIAIQGNNILYRGVKNGRRVKEKIQYSPVLYLLTEKESEFKTLFGKNLMARRFNTIRDARDFVNGFEGVGNFPIYGNDRYEYAFIADEHKGQIDWDIRNISIAVIDIEVGSENGFPDPYKAEEPIISIALSYLNGPIVIFGCGDYQTKGSETYIKCDDEWSLSKKFLQYWQENCPDVISGWNIDGFDIPYLYNRFNRIIGEDETNKLSPWNNVWERSYIFKGQQKKSYTITGVAALDYIELYRWYAPGGKSQESYKLDHIAFVELGKKKLDYSEYDSLHQLYKHNYQKFIEYNIIDVNLIFELEEKLKLIELGLTLAYDTKTNYDDVFAQTRMWDSLIYSYLLEKKIIVPPRVVKKKDEAFEGAYVKDPQVGMHDWVASFDLNSLYPHLMVQYNISPETLVEPKNYTPPMIHVLGQGVTVDRLLEKKISIRSCEMKNATVTPNGQIFRTDIQGFLPKMMEEMYEDRKKFKKMMLKAKQEYLDEKDPVKKQEIENLVARYNNLQLAKKVSLNSAYGAMGSQYFRFYDLRQALAVTLAGQLSIRWIENKINEFMNKLLKTDKDYVIASDTDSIYLRLNELVDKVVKDKSDVKKVISFMDKVCEEKLQPYIDASYQELADYVQAYSQKMQMKREVLANKGFWTAKKRYVLNVHNSEGVEYEEPDMKVMGLEIVKSSTPYVIREKMKDVVKLILDTDEETVQKYLLKYKEEFKKLDPQDIAFPRGINGLREYSDSVSLYKKGTPIHVRGAILYNHYLKQMDLTTKYPLIQEGEKLKFIYLKTPNTFKEDVISFPVRLPKEFNLDEFIDYETMFNKSFIDPIETILDSIGWSAKKQNTLDSFFS